MSGRPWAGALVALAWPSIAAAQDLRDLCPTRPGLNTAPCIVDPGHVLVETGLADWTREEEGGVRSDTLLLGDTLVRLGLTDRFEIQLGWTPLGLDREAEAGRRMHDWMTGDITAAAKLSLANPDGSGFSIAVQGEATLPTGGEPIGAGDWGASLLLPVSYDLSDTLHLQATPEIDAEPDEDGEKRHLRFGSAAGIGADLTDAISASVEIQALRDEDPEGHATELLAGLSAAWQPSDDLQLDLGTNIGLNRDSPDAELYVGISRRF